MNIPTLSLTKKVVLTASLLCVLSASTALYILQTYTLPESGTLTLSADFSTEKPLVVKKYTSTLVFVNTNLTEGTEAYTSQDIDGSLVTLTCTLTENEWIDTRTMNACLIPKFNPLSKKDIEAELKKMNIVSPLFCRKGKLCYSVIPFTR